MSCRVEVCSPVTAVLVTCFLFWPAAGTPQDPAEEEPPVLGAPSDIRPPEDASVESVWVDAGARLHARPDVRSSTVALIDARIELPVLERRAHWLQVRYGSWQGWIAPETPPTPRDGQPLASEVIAWRLALAREMLGPEGRSQRLDSFDLLTDVSDRTLLRFLAQVAGHLPEAYRERFQLDPQPGSQEVVILFTREEDYRAYEARVRPGADRGALGHADQGLAVLYVGRQGPEDVAAVLVHELTHVLNQRLFQAEPSPWLDEGMANDLAFCRIDGGRRLELGSLGGRSVVIEQHSYRPGGWLGVDQAIHLSGPAAAFSLLRERWRTGGALSVELLTDLAPGEFFDPSDRQTRYDASTFFVRYLLDGDDGELASGFRAFLAALAGGETADPTTLASYLGRGWPKLEKGFDAWLRRTRPGR